jgi:OOP family OmpA-OmpF porin
MGNFMAGVTGQIKLSDRVALTADFTTTQRSTNSLMALALTVVIQVSKRFYGEIFNGTVGITVYLGKK